MQSVLLFGRISTISNDHCDVSFFFFFFFFFSHGSEAYVQTAFQLGNAGIQNVPICGTSFQIIFKWKKKCRYFCLSGM